MKLFSVDLIIERNRNLFTPILAILLKDLINAAAKPVCNETQTPEKGCNDAKKVIQDAANIIRAEIKECKGISIQPLRVDDLNMEISRAIIPSLYSLLQNIISPAKHDVENTNDNGVELWSGINVLVNPRSPQETIIGYCPMMQANSVEFSTIFTIIKQAQAMTASLGQASTVITFDLAIYIKAKQIQWKHPEEFSNTVIRLGGFHIALNYLSLLGKKYMNSGIQDMLVKSGAYGEGIIKG